MTIDKDSSSIFYDSESYLTGTISKLLYEQGDLAAINFIRTQIHIKPYISRKKLVLASQSPRRQTIFSTIFKTPFRIMSAQSEETLPQKVYPPAIVTKTLALIKLISCLKSNPTDSILTCDTLVFLDNAPLGKPQSSQEALAMLQSYLGKTQFVSTAVALYCAHDQNIYLIEDQVELQFQNPSPEVDLLISHYLNLKEDGRGFQGKAGGYGLQEPEILWLIEHIHGDPFTAVGLPLQKTHHLLQKHGFEVAPLPPTIALYTTLWGQELWGNKDYYWPEKATRTKLPQIALAKITMGN